MRVVFVVRTAGAWAVAVAVAALVAGCGGGFTGTATPPPGGGSVAPSAGSSPGGDATRAPKPPRQLDASNLIARGCSALTKAQLHAVDVSGDNPSVENFSGLGKGCVWHDQQNSNAVGVGWVTANKNGLQDVYAKQHTWPYFIPTTVSGFPAVFTSLADLRKSGACSISVGVSDHLTFFSQYQAGPGGLQVPQACDLAKQAAADVIKNLGG